MDRRDFIKHTSLATAAFSFSGFTAIEEYLNLTRKTEVIISVEAGTKTMVDGRQIYTWQFQGSSRNRGPGVLGSGLLAREGDKIGVTLENNLDRPVNFVIPGVLENTPEVQAGATLRYSFTAPSAGGYLYFDGINGELSKAMGLAGPLIVLPADGSNTLYNNGPSFDLQYTLVFQEIDDRINQAVFSGSSYDLDHFEPNYFFVNGLSYPDTASDQDTLIQMSVGQTVAIRMLNAGLITNPMHYHGYHVEVASRNRIPESAIIEKDTVLVKVEECVDVLLRCNQSGAYPLHTHYVPGVTANGVYVNPYGGALLVMIAT